MPGFCNEMDMWKGLCGCIVSAVPHLGHQLKIGPKALLYWGAHKLLV